MTGPWRDPGLQPERTALAWRRTTLTAVVVVAICVRAWVVHPTVWLALAIVAIVAVIALTTVGQVERFRRSRHNPTDPRPLPRALMMGTSALIAMAAAATVLGFLVAMRG